MSYDNEYNRKLVDQVKALNNRFIENGDLEDAGMGSGLSGGFLGALASAVLPSIIGKIFGNGSSGGCMNCSCGKGMSGAGMQAEYRDLEGSGKGVMLYQKQKEDTCGMGSSGGSGFAAGTQMDTGFDKTKGIEGSGFISDLNIPIVSGLAGMFGLGASGGKKRGRKSKMASGMEGKGKSGGVRVRGKKINTDTVTFAPKATDLDSKNNKVVEKAVMPSSSMSGMGKSGGRKPTAWSQLVKDVLQKNKELKGVKAAIEYIKKNNLYKK